MKITLSMEEFKVLYGFLGKLSFGDEQLITNYKEEDLYVSYLVYDRLLNHYKSYGLQDVNEVDFNIWPTAIGRFLEWMGYIDKTSFMYISDTRELNYKDEEYKLLFDVYKRMIKQYRIEVFK